MKTVRARLVALAVVGLLALFTTAANAGTTGIITGVVKDAATGAFLSGANIILSGTQLTTVTDASGRFVITNVPPGEYVVTAEMIGYALGEVAGLQVTMDATAAANFELTQETLEETATVVKRSRRMINPEVPVAFTTIGAKQEDATRQDPLLVHTASGILNSLPGASVEPNGSGQVHLRGGRYDLTGWYVEGIPVVDANQGIFQTNLFTTGLSHFQAYTGGFGAEFGNAIAGTINEVKKTGDMVPGISLALEGGSNAYGNTYAEVGGGTADTFNYYVGTNLFKSNLDNLVMDREEYADTTAKLVWPSKNNKYTLLAMQGSMAGFLNNMSNGYMRQRFSVNGFTWSHNFSDNSFINVIPYYAFSTYIWDPDGSNTAFLDTWSTRMGLKVDYTSQLNEKHLFKAGWSWATSNNNYRLVYPGAPAMYNYQCDVDTSQMDLYAEDRFKINDKWAAQLGLRYDGIEYDRTGKQYVDNVGYTGPEVGDVSESTISPRLGVTYQPDSNTAWKVAWGKYTKFVPAYSVQRIYDDPSGEQSMAGLGATSPHDSTQIELSYEKQVSDDIALRITPFYAKYENLGEHYWDGDTNLMYYTVLGEGKTTGVEMHLRKKMSENWSGWLSYTYQKAKANRADLGVVNDFYHTNWDQSHYIALVADYKNGDWNHSLRLDFGSGWADVVINDPTIAAQGNHANPYAVLSYNVKYDLPQNSPLGNEVYLNIYNIFNSRQILRFNNDGGGRDPEAKLSPRFITFGVTRSY